MKLLSILDHLADAPTTAGPSPRRALLRQAGQAAVAALPLGLGLSLPAAARPQTAYDALTQLLQLERLQEAYYTQALAVAGLIPADQRPDFQRMLAHQNRHVAFLTQALQLTGGLLPPVPQFDFSGRHNVATNPVLFPNVLSSYDDFLALAQQLEDLGVRTYGTYVFTFTDDATLTRTLLRVLPVEGEHAAHVRGLRRNRGATVKTWPSSTDAPIARPAAAQALTNAASVGEDNTAQLKSPGVNIPFADFLSVFKLNYVPDTALAEAFDEPLTNTDANTAARTIQAALDLFV